MPARAFWGGDEGN